MRSIHVLLGSLLLASSLPAIAAAQVTLSLDEYRKLRARAQAPEVEPPPPPAPYALEVAELEIEAGTVSARLTQNLTFTVFADGWQRIPLGRSGSFTHTEWRGLEGRVEGGAAGSALVVRGRGRHSVRLESVLAMARDETSTRPAWRFELSAPPAATIRGRLRAAEGVEEATLAASQEPQVAALREEGTRVWSFVDLYGPERTLRFGLFGKRILPEKAQLPLRFDARAMTVATLTRTQLLVEAQIVAQVAQGRLSELQLEVPAGLEVVAVDGGVAGWQVQGEGAQRVLQVVPLEPVEKSIELKVRLRGRFTESFDSPLLMPRGSRRTSYLTKAVLQGDGLLDLVAPGSGRASTVVEREAFGQSSERRLLAVADPRQPPRWQVVWAEGTEVLAAQVDRLLIDAAVGAAGRAAYQVWAVVRNRGALTFELALPPGFELIDAARDGQLVAPGRDAAGAFSVPLASGEAAQVIHLRGVMPLALPAKSGDWALPLPSLSAPAAKVETRLVLPSGHDYELADPTRRQHLAAPPDVREQGDRRQAAARSNVIAQQVVSFLDSPSSQAAFFTCPAGYLSLSAGWSALSAMPAPLKLRVDLATEAASWF
jgi:hypothetical protein